MVLSSLTVFHKVSMLGTAYVKYNYLLYYLQNILLKLFGICNTSGIKKLALVFAVHQAT